MKVLPKDSVPSPWTKIIHCTGKGWNNDHTTPCLHPLEIEATDVRSRTHTDYGGGTDTYYGVVCPQCNAFTEINEKEIPVWVRNSARKYFGYSKEFDR